MTTGRTLWIMFCLGWVGFWLIFGWFFLPVINVMLALGSIIMIAIPIGKPQRQAFPPSSQQEIGWQNRDMR